MPRLLSGLTRACRRRPGRTPASSPAWGLTLALLAFALGACRPAAPPLAMVVMDPLARDLACPCVGGYAQRDYRALATRLTRATGRRIEAVFADELGKGLRQAGPRPVALVIGKDSLVRSDAATNGLTVAPLCRLTDRDDRTTLTGLFVVRQADPARTLADLAGRRIYFGPADSDEKHAAAIAALAAAGVKAPERIETRAGCSEAGACVVEDPAAPGSAGVISSYALPLLEGCGSVPAGALRVVGETRPVPFITVFAATAHVSPPLLSRLQEALLEVRADAALLEKLESKQGFVDHEGAAAALGATTWPGWRGVRCDGHTAWLPERLPAEARFAWRQPLSGPGLAGLAATDDLVLVADRDPKDERDAFLAFRTTDGGLAWQLDYPATADLDYGRAPRATPVVRDGRAFLLGAAGQLHCVNMRDGRVIWRKDLARDFGATVPKWGYCSPPLLVDDRIIVNPGATNASLVALDARSGRVVWQTPGAPAAYGGFIVADLGGRRQIVGHDQSTLGGWDPGTGRRLWTLTPPQSGDFNVPTPVAVEGRLLVVTENNGARLFGFRDGGLIVPEPLAQTEALMSETTSPVVAGGWVFGWDATLHGLDLRDGLKEAWKFDEPDAGEHASLLASEDRLLVATRRGELLLVGLRVTGAPSVVSRLRYAPVDSQTYVHPAIAGRRLFLRDERSLLCLPLDPPTVAGRSRP